jgi:hypothetical protein
MLLTFEVAVLPALLGDPGHQQAHPPGDSGTSYDLSQELFDLIVEKERMSLGTLGEVSTGDVFGGASPA